MVPTLKNRTGRSGEAKKEIGREAMTWLTRFKFELLLRLFLGGLFLYSGGAKLLDPAAFQGEIANFELLSWTFSGLVAVYLPWLEIACGFALVAGWQLGGSLLILSSLMVAFIIFVGSAWARGLDVSCGCFGASDEIANYPLWIGRNLLILAGLVAAFWLRRFATVNIAGTPSEGT